MKQMSSAIQTAINQAADAAVPSMVVTNAQNHVSEARRQAIEEAREGGVAIRVTPSFVHIDDGREKWPSELAAMLCNEPGLASETNDELMRRVSRRLGLAVQLSGNTLSKVLSVRARKYSAEILARHGFDGSAIEKGTDIKRVVKGNVRLHQANKRSISTTFEADGIVLDGRKHLYRIRERAATGLPWNDFCIRIAGADIPLTAVLKLRGLGIADFQDADEAACKRADAGSMQRRTSISRTSRHKSRRPIDALPADLQETQTGGVECARLARLWWAEMSPTRRATTSFWELVLHLKEVGGDELESNEVVPRLDRWTATFGLGEEVQKGQVKRELECLA